MTGFDPLDFPFDQFQRYHAVQQVAERLRTGLAEGPRPEGVPLAEDRRLRVLDVGGMTYTPHGDPVLPLTCFLPDDDVIAVDLLAWPLAPYAVASGQALPFPDRSFDLAASCDTLEHVPPQCRGRFVEELLRVAQHAVVLVAPFDAAATWEAEQALYEYLTAQGLRQFHLREHLDLGLPDAQSLRAHLAAMGRPWIEWADGTLDHWLAMMLLKHTPVRVLPLSSSQRNREGGSEHAGQAPTESLGGESLDRGYIRDLAPFDGREPTYRRVFVVAAVGDEALLQSWAVDLAASSGPPQLAFCGRLLSGLSATLAHATAERLAVHEQLAAAQAAAARSEVEQRRLQELVTGYEKGRFMRFMRWLHSRRPATAPVRRPVKQ